jgi:hypothetical protein
MQKSRSSELVVAIVITVLFWPVGLYLLYKYFHNAQSRVASDRIPIKTHEYNGVEITTYGKKHIEEYDDFINGHITRIKSIAKIQAQNIRYKEFESGDQVYKYLFPKNDNKTCSKCGTVFGAPLKRGKTCLDCKTKLIVRTGIILTEKQLKTAEQWLIKVQKLYEPLHVRQVLPTDHNFTYTEKLIELSHLYQNLGMYDDAWKLVASDNDGIIAYEDKTNDTYHCYNKISKARAFAPARKADFSINARISFQELWARPLWSCSW